MLTACFVYAADAQPGKYILMLSKAEHKMFVLDYTTLALITKIPVGIDPHEIATSPDGHTAYVSVPILNGRGHEINVINLRKLIPEKTIDTAPFYTPHGLAYVHDKLWFTAQGSKVVATYSPLRGEISEVFGTGQDFTHLLQVREDGRRFYTTNVESGTLSIFELLTLPPYMPPTGVVPPTAKPRTEWRQTLVSVGRGAEGFDISADGKELWTARPDGFVLVVDLQRKAVVDSINTGIAGLHRLKITPDGRSVCVVSVKTGDLLYYDRMQRTLEKREQVGRGAGIFMDAESGRMFISCTPDNYVLVIDLKTRREIGRLPIGRPDGVSAVTVQ